MNHTITEEKIASTSDNVSGTQNMSLSLGVCAECPRENVNHAIMIHEDGSKEISCQNVKGLVPVCTKKSYEDCEYFNKPDWRFKHNK